MPRRRAMKHKPVKKPATPSRLRTIGRKTNDTLELSSDMFWDGYKTHAVSNSIIAALVGVVGYMGLKDVNLIPAGVADRLPLGPVGPDFGSTDLFG